MFGVGFSCTWNSEVDSRGKLVGGECPIIRSHK